MPLIETASGTIWYADHRDVTVHRPPVLMIHGAGGTHLDWPAELRRMPEANAIIPDLPGHGKSPGSGRMAVSAYAADMVALLDALKLKQAIIAGHSMGGAVAMTMALTAPDRVLGLILIGTGAKLGVHSDILNGIMEELRRSAELITDWAWALSSGEQVRRLSLMRLLENDPRVLFGDYSACNVFDIRDQLNRIAVPALVIGGTEDQMTPLKYGVYLQENIPNARLVTVEGGGHMMALEQPHIVAGAVQNWLNAFE
jgi:pimeloyl-ACP methyl ester carboxylesterase